MVGEEIKLLVNKGRKQGYLTLREVNEFLPPETVSAEQIDDIHTMLNEMGIDVRDE